MTNLEFNQAHNENKNNVVFTDVDGVEYVHTIIKAGKRQVNLFNNLLKKEYKLSFSSHTNYSQYKIHKP